MIDTIYYTGHLWIGSGSTGEDSPRARDSDLARRCDTLYRAQEEGKVILYQRRVPEGFEYHARAIKGAA